MSWLTLCANTVAGTATAETGSSHNPGISRDIPHKSRHMVEGCRVCTTWSCATQGMFEAGAHLLQGLHLTALALGSLKLHVVWEGQRLGGPYGQHLCNQVMSTCETTHNRLVCAATG